MSAGTGCTISDTAGKLKEEAEKSDRVRPGDVLTEAASGNAGVGLPPGGGPEGLQDDHQLADEMSGERVNTMKCLSAGGRRTPGRSKGLAEVSSGPSLLTEIGLGAPGSSRGGTWA